MHAQLISSTFSLMQGLPVTAEAAALLPKALPTLSALHLLRCEQDTTALLTALCNCEHLSSLSLEDPQHTDPSGLAAAHAAEASAEGKAAVEACAQGLSSVQGMTEAGALQDAQCAAATGMLLGRLHHLTSLTLSMRGMPAALRMLGLGGGGGKLQSLRLDDPGAHAEGMPSSVMTEVLVPALSACTSLTSLDLATLCESKVFTPLPSCPALRGLHSLRVPQQWVDLAGLDAILQNLPGEAPRRLLSPALPWKPCASYLRGRCVMVILGLRGHIPM